MRVLLRSLDTGAFFRAHEDWTHDPKEALDFVKAELATTVAKELGLSNVELHFCSDGGQPLFGTLLPGTSADDDPRAGGNNACSANRSILLAEDDRNDEKFICRALRRTGFQNPVHVVHTGDEAINYLSGEGQYGDRAKFPMPYLFLLDPGIPGKTGWEVLRWVRERQEISALVVIILGGSGNPVEEDMAFRLGAMGYHLKPATIGELEQLIKQIGGRWLLPGKVP